MFQATHAYKKEPTDEVWNTVALIKLIYLQQW